MADIRYNELANRYNELANRDYELTEPVSIRTSNNYNEYLQRIIAVNSCNELLQRTQQGDFAI